MRVKMSKQPPLAPTASAEGPCPTEIQIVGRPGTGSLPSPIAPPDHPPGTQRYTLSFKDIGQLVLKLKIFKYFYYIWAWWLYWSFDLDGLNIFLFSKPQEALHKIWLQLAYRIFQRCLKLSYFESPGPKVKQ